MNEVLDTIERELMVAIRRRNARRRRRRRLGFFSGAVFAVTLTIGGGVAAIPGSPLENLLSGNAGEDLGVVAQRQPPPDAAQGSGRSPARTDMTLTDAIGTHWTVTNYKARGGWIVATAVPERLPRRVPDLVGRNAFTLASALADGPAIGVWLTAAQHDGRVGRLLVGQVDATARSVAVELGGRRYEAQLSPDAITAKVQRPPEDDLLPAGRALLERLGPTISLRTFAVALPEDAIASGTSRLSATIETTLDDGTSHVESDDRLCVSERCGVEVYELPDQDG
ncbi:hypothetical protein [Conexibacter sp. CPCC 206217]|uniref:hypothetical protein n=1 Tax=Conexibacter sp. CPCC 206217 TaxID=3064574 RepID=UPI0027272B29|nr:hypothetical protein [Conexibacter sp. CPCC 206217]MDO8214097.1 hypothetical protein [Conexibacter sp. CPCC 206217]